MKIGKSKRQSSAIREQELSRIPLASDLRNLLAKAQRNSQQSIELPFYTAESPVRLTVVVKCEQYGKNVAFWTLYRTDVAGAPAMWTQQSIDIDSLRNLIELGYSTAAEAHRAQGSGGSAAENAGSMLMKDVDPSAPPTRKANNKPTTETYLAHLQSSGKYVDPFTQSASAAQPVVNEGAATESSAECTDEDSLFLEAERGLTLSDEDFAREAAMLRAAEAFDESAGEPLPVTTESGEQQFGFNDASSSKVSEPVSIDQAFSGSKERKQQALTAVVLRLSTGDVLACKSDVVEAVRLVINPFDTGTVSNTIAEMVVRDLKALVKQFGDKNVANSLSETFKAMLKGKPAPADSEIALITSKWFF